MSLFCGRLLRRLRAAVLDGHLDRLEDLLDGRVSRRTSTTCWSSAPAAPGCAPRSRRRPAGVSVGLVCKSLLGKAHTVMAEGGIAAALANVDDRDNWQVHFADTMRGGQYLNNWRMAELHAKEAPDRVRELEAWGALFDRTHGRPHPAAQLRRPPLPAPRARRRPHRPGDDPHAAGPRHPPGHRRAHGVHRRHAAQGRRPRRRRVRLRPRARPLPACSSAKAVVLATGGIGRAYKITSNSWEYTGDGHALAYHAGAELIDMEFVQFHPTGMVWPPSVRGILVTEGVRGEGGVLRNNDGKRFMFDDIPENYRSSDRRQRGGRLALHAGRQERAPAARAADARPRRALHRARGQGGPRQPARRRLPRHRLDQGAAARTPPSTSRRSCRACTTSSSSWPTSTSPASRWRSGPTTHYIMGGVRVDADTQMSTRARACSPPASAPPGCTARTAWAATRCPTCWCSASAPASTRRSSRSEHAARPTSTPTQVDEAARRALAPFERGDGGESPYQIQHELQEMMQDLVGIVRTRGRDAAGARRRSSGCRQRARAGAASPGNREYNPGWHTALDLRQPADRLRGDHARGARAQGKPRRRTSARTIPDKDDEFGKFNIVVRKGPDGRDAGRARADPDDAARSCKQIIEEMK